LLGQFEPGGPCRARDALIIGEANSQNYDYYLGDSGFLSHSTTPKYFLSFRALNDNLAHSPLHLVERTMFGLEKSIFPQILMCLLAIVRPALLYVSA
jgi:hypothetical protein